jgi:hypothetical protein
MSNDSSPLLVLRPKPGTQADQLIAKGSGVVGYQGPDDAGGKPTFIVSYEGNLYGAANLRDWRDRVMHAADRLATGYPTVARAVLPKEQFDVVGLYDRSARRLVLIMETPPA